MLTESAGTAVNGSAGLRCLSSPGRLAQGTAGRPLLHTTRLQFRLTPLLLLFAALLLQQLLLMARLRQVHNKCPAPRHSQHHHHQLLLLLMV
jgi:hypothetical protein